MARRTHRTEKLNLRLTSVAKQTLQAAAIAECKSISAFVLDAALSQAQEQLADRRIFMLNAGNWDAFVAALDAPPATGALVSRASIQAADLYVAPSNSSAQVWPTSALPNETCGSSSTSLKPAAS